MTPRNPRDLLGGYEAGTLTPEERDALFAAALKDEQLFAELVNAEPVRAALAEPIVRAEMLELVSERRRSWLSRFWMVPAGAGALALAALTIAILIGQGERKPVETAGLKPSNQPAMVAPGSSPSPARPTAPERVKARVGEPKEDKRVRERPASAKTAVPAAPPPPPAMIAGNRVEQPVQKKETQAQSRDQAQDSIPVAQQAFESPQAPEQAPKAAFRAQAVRPMEARPMEARPMETRKMEAPKTDSGQGDGFANATLSAAGQISAMSGLRYAMESDGMLLLEPNINGFLYVFQLDRAGQWARVSVVEPAVARRALRIARGDTDLTIVLSPSRLVELNAQGPALSRAVEGLRARSTAPVRSGSGSDHFVAVPPGSAQRILVLSIKAGTE